MYFRVVSLRLRQCRFTLSILPAPLFRVLRTITETLIPQTHTHITLITPSLPSIVSPTHCAPSITSYIALTLNYNENSRHGNYKSSVPHVFVSHPEVRKLLSKKCQLQHTYLLFNSALNISIRSSIRAGIRWKQICAAYLIAVL